MTENAEEIYSSFSPQQIKELTAIYDDYLYITRLHEQLLQQSSLEYLAYDVLEHMYPENPTWEIEKMTPDETRKFADFLENNGADNSDKAYITLQHIKPEENSWKPPVFAIHPYMNRRVNMPLPSQLERYTLTYPQQGNVGDIEFYIDGRYKVRYTDEKIKNTPINEYINSPQMAEELGIMVNMAESFSQNERELNEDKLMRLSLRVYAAERIASNENIILELLGSFAEKVQNICRERYNLHDSLEVLTRAQNEGLIHSAADFKDYVNIRHFMRHQWDTLDELGYFTSTKSDKNKNIRQDYVNSYLKLCDKSMVQRMKSYMSVLHQMQQIIGKINPQRFIRDVTESNNKFAARLKAVYRQNPMQPIEVETNYPLAEDKYKALSKNLRKIIPNIRIIDDFSEKMQDQYANIDCYDTRSWFLQTFNSAECLAMRHCIIRGRNLKNRESWEYLKEIGLITPQEYETWYEYTNLRNDLSHNYFDTALRKRLNKIEETYREDLQSFADKMFEVGPDVRKIQDGVYEYTHKDGSVVLLDIKNHTISCNGALAEQHPKKNKKIKSYGAQQYSDGVQKEVYPNGVEYSIVEGEITEVKLPNGICINTQQQSISWDNHTGWYMNAERFNALQTKTCKILTDKNFQVTEYINKNKRHRFRGNDHLLTDGNSVLLDKWCRFREFRYKKSGGNILQTGFKHTHDGLDVIALSGGTNVLHRGKMMIVTHGNQTLSYDNRREFAATYSGTPIPPQQMVKNGQPQR